MNAEELWFVRHHEDNEDEDTVVVLASDEEEAIRKAGHDPEDYCDSCGSRVWVAREKQD